MIPPTAPRYRGACIVACTLATLIVGGCEAATDPQIGNLRAQVAGDGQAACALLTADGLR